MIVWLEKPLLVAIHERQVAEHGGDPGVRDEGQIESALARPRQLQATGDPSPDLADLAAALAYGLARNHPFVDGNKRTSHVAYRTFLVLNGSGLNATDEEKYIAILILSAGTISEPDFAAWLRERLGSAQCDEARQPRAAYRVKARTPTGRKPRADLPRSAA